MDDNYNLKNKSIDRKYVFFFIPWITAGFDYVAVMLSVYVAFILRKYVFLPAAPHFNIGDIYFFITPLFFIIFLKSEGAYLRDMPFINTAKKIFLATLYSIIVAVFLMYFSKVSGDVSRIFVFTTWFMSFWCLLIERWILAKLFSKSKQFKEPLLIVGAGKTSEIILESFKRDSGFNYEVIGFMDDNPKSNYIKNNYKVFGSIEETVEIIKEKNLDSLLISAPGLEKEKLVDLLNVVEPHVTTIEFIPDLIGVPVGGLEVRRLIDARLVLMIVRNNLARVYNKILKRFFDLFLCLLALPLFLLISIIISILIYIDSPGPVIFAHHRIGKHGKEFSCYKFRSMVTNSKEYLEEYLANNPKARNEWERDYKLKDDPRVTRIGKFLRKTSLDELPQVLNVIKGEMSLVGPRPIIRDEIVKYGEYINDFYLVPPGITGVWQVSGRNNLSFEERVKLDKWYIQNWSLWMDFVIFMKTIKVVLGKVGAR